MSQSADASVPDVVFHMALPDEWAAAFATGSYEMSTRGVTLAEQGFIHCSRLDQVETVANRFYGDVSELVLLTIDVAAAGAPVIDEPAAPGSNEVYPHLYGALPIAAVIDATFWVREHDRWVMPSR